MIFKHFCKILQKPNVLLDLLFLFRFAKLLDSFSKNTNIKKKEWTVRTTPLLLFGKQLKIYLLI